MNWGWLLLAGLLGWGVCIFCGWMLAEVITHA